MHGPHELKRRVRKMLAIARQQEPVVDVLKDHNVIALSNENFYCCKNLGEDLWQRVEPERARLIPELALSHLEGQELAVLWMYRDVMVRVTEVDASHLQAQ